MAKFCRYCGKEVNDTATFCRHCGKQLGQSEAGIQQTSQFGQSGVLMQPANQPINTQVQYDVPVQPMYQTMPVQKEKSCPRCGRLVKKGVRFCRGCGYNFAARRSRRIAISTTAIMMVLVLLITGFGWPGFIRKAISGKHEFEYSAKTSTTEDVVIGDIDKDGVELNIAAGTFPVDTTITMRTMSDKELKDMDKDGYTYIGTPVEFDIEDYDGTYFDEPVTMTIDISDEKIEDDMDLLAFTAAYYNESIDEWYYVQPDWIDADAGLMQVTLEHFCFWSWGKKSEDEQIDEFLNKYAEEKLRRENNYNEAQEAFSPYLADIKEKAKLSDAAFNQLVRDIICCSADKLTNAGKAGMWKMSDTQEGILGQTTLYVECQRAYEEGDPMIGANALASYMEEQTAQVFFEGPWAKALASGDKFAAAYGAYEGGDYKGAIEQLIGAGFNFMPSSAAAANSAVNYVVKKADYHYTCWKSDKVDELYKIYKNGKEGTWNDVPAQDMDALWNYLDYGYGIMSNRGIYRLYQSDQISKLCERYGWGSVDYASLPADKQNIFTQRARESLEEYFKSRLENETKIEQIKEEEREFITEIKPLLADGLLYDYFGEEGYGKLDVDKRLQKLFDVRQQISYYIDENAMKTKNIHYGDLVDVWVNSCGYNTTKTNDELMQEFLKYLDEQGILLEELKGLLDQDIFGEWSVTMTIDDFGSGLTDQLVDNYTQAMGEMAGLYGEYGIDMSGMEEYQQMYEDAMGQSVGTTTTGTMTIEESVGGYVTAVITYEGSPSNTYTGTYDEYYKILTLTNDNPDVLDPGLELQFGVMNGRPYFEGKVDYDSDIANYSYTITGYKN